MPDQIILEQEREIRYWTALLAIDEETLKQAVEAVGTSPATVSLHLAVSRHLRPPSQSHTAI
jgi:hypothetical protein